jgi:hypothetical protein
VAGAYDICYADGAVERVWMRDGREIGSWWGISDRHMGRSATRRAWWGANAQWKTVGLYMHGWDNPRPGVPITAIRIETLKTGGRGGGIMLAAISASDQPVAFEPTIRSYGLPDCWAQAAVYYAIAEGLAGIEDKATTFADVKVSPRWARSKAGTARAVLHYPSSGGYCAYEYRLDRARRRVTLDLTGSFRTAQVHCLLPAGKARRVTVDGADVPFRNTTVERSHYADFALQGLPRGSVVVEY